MTDSQGSGRVERTQTVMHAAMEPPRRGRRVRRLVRWVLALILVLVLAFAVFFFWASGTNDGAGGRLVNRDGGAVVAPRELKVMTFNVAYGRGPAGDLSGPWTEEHIRRHLDGIAAQIRDSGADLVFMQEVDLGAARSHDIDEGDYLLEKSGLASASCVVTWDKNYVPFPYWPPSRHYGRMLSGQCVLSRYRIEASVHHDLPQPESNPWWRNRFYLERKIDEVHVLIGATRWTVFNVHTEAFDGPNRMEHAKILAGLVAAVPDKAHVIVAGDFNAPPPEATQKKGFVDEPETDFSDDQTVAILRGTGLGEVLPDPTVFTFPADAPTRRLDYIWYGAALEKLDAKVLTAPPGPWSDHLPVLAHFSIK